jgi:predicted sulfurtransferase
MREAGLENVWQLEGGILKYFEETGGAHFRGECFVFDGREALRIDLSAKQLSLRPCAAIQCLWRLAKVTGCRVEPGMTKKIRTAAPAA